MTTTESVSIREGELIGGRYRPLRVLGAGGMGRVLEAEDLEGGGRVALKVPVQAIGDDPRARARFVREAQAAALLDHPNVVRVLDVVSRDDGAPVMVLELLEGETLAARLGREGRLSPAATADALVPVIEALQQAHRRGLVHRDVKPDNIFLAEVDGALVPKLLDFGITKVLQRSLGSTMSQTITGQIIGTPDYMAPEQLCGEAEIDARVDVWAVGVVLYECLAGVRPFAGANVGQLMRAILLHPSVPLLHRAPELPVELALAVGDALAPVDERPRELTALLDALRPEGGATARSGDEEAERASPAARRGGQRRPISVLIAAPVERGARITDPQRAFRHSQALRERAREIARDLDATLVDPPGPEVALLFGLPSARSSDARRAVAAAERLHAELPAALQIGIACGHLVVGASATGAGAVDLAWAQAEPWQAAVDLARSADAGATALAEPVARACEPLAGAPVGRRRELWRLAGLLDECGERRRGAVILLRGEAGIGKTTLAREVLAEASARGLRSLAAPIFDFGAHPELDVARGLFGELYLEHRGALAQEHRLVLDELLRLPMSEEAQAESRALTPRMRSQLRGAAIRRVLERAAGGERAADRERAAGLALWIDDVHWADPPSLELVVLLLRAVAELPVVLLLTTRPVEAPKDPAWQAALREARPLIVELGPLSDDDALALARRHLHDDALARRCVERSGGNPLFLLSLVRDLEPTGGKVPASVDSVVAARLDRLDPEAVSAVQAASVLGRRFGVDALDHLVVGAHTQLPALIAAELLEADADAYLFRHDLVRDAVYGGLLPEARSALHRRAATWYRERDPLMVARHLDGAHDPEAAAAYLEAARHEQAIQRLPSALALARRGELLAEDEALSVELGLTCGELERRLGMVDDSLATFRALAPRAASEAQRLRAYLGQADALNLSDRHDEALAVLGRASGSTEEPALLAAIHSLRGNILFSCGDSSSCRREHERALAAARRAGDAAAEARALNGIGDAYYLTGAYRSTHGALHECIAIAQREQMPALESLSWSISAASRVFYGDVVGAHEEVQRAEALADQAMDAKAQVLAASVAAKVNLYLLDLDASERAGQRVLARSRRVGTLRLAQYALLRIAWVAERRGQPELAMRRLEEAWTLASEVGKLFLGSALLAGMAVLDRSRAAALLDEGEAILRDGPGIDHNTLYFHVHGVRAAYQIGDEARLRRYAQALLDDQGESRELRGFHGKCGLLLADLLAGRSEALAELRALHGWALAQSLRWDAALLDELLVERGA